MNSTTRKILCILCAILAAVCVIVACFTLVRRKSSAEASSSSAASVSEFGEVSGFDYENFDYGDGLDDSGYWSGIKASDYVTLPDGYRAIPLSKSDLDPTEDEVQFQLDSLLNQYTAKQEVTGRAAQSGDIANIDYSGSVDGTAFTGGTASGYDLTLGSGSFIDGFEDQIIGHNVGDTFDVTVTFPDGYSDSTDAEGNTITLSGKQAVFTVTLNSLAVNVTPELTDDWVDSNFGTSNDLHTADALRSYFQDALYTDNFENAIVDYLMDNSTFNKELPGEITGYYIRMFLNYYNQYASAYGMDLNAFAQTQGYTDADTMLAASDAYFEHLAKQDLIFQAIAEAEGITPSQEQLSEAESTYAAYGQQRAHLNALQSCILDWLEANASVS